VTDILVGLVMLYLALMVFPLILKMFGLGVIANPLIKFIHWLLLLPLRLAASALRRHRVPR
jgi:hypothetical protein